MINQIEAVLAQYEIEVHEIKKGRGIYICETELGEKALVPFRGSKEKAAFLQMYLKEIKEAGFCVEQILLNKNQEALTKEESTGESFLLKDYITGVELDVDCHEDLNQAVELLAAYHKVSENIAFEVPEIMKGVHRDIVEIRQRHYKELIKVRNYIRGRKKKTEFELIFMRACESMLIAAEESINILAERKRFDPQCVLCHGEYNHHNILRVKERWHIVNFENVIFSWPMLDLAQYMRKMLEKNKWEVALGNRLVESYGRVRPMRQEEYVQLYGLLLFPEKFWKVTNHYMNSRKSWISEKDIEKLKTVIEQENLRRNFLQKLFSFPKE